MEYIGLVQKYPVNRPLRDEERELQLRQKQRLDIELSSQLCVIRLNSTFVEIVDKYFAWKGMLTFLVVGGMLMISGGMLLAGFRELFAPRGLHWFDTAATFAVAIIFALAMGWFAYFECFRHTHYPIRLNRKTRMVHVFRTNGTVFSVSWDKVFFCLGRGYNPRHWEIQGHVLADDGNTVLETFSLSVLGVGLGDREVLKHFWEYVRRYMEEGPANLKDRMNAVLPIATARETFWFGVQREMSMGGVFMVLIYVFLYPGRWLAMRTSKIPQWPQEIEDQCLIEPGDPYVREASKNPR